MLHRLLLHHLSRLLGALIVHLRGRANIAIGGQRVAHSGDAGTAIVESRKVLPI